jgi:hypothetical protein
MSHRSSIGALAVTLVLGVLALLAFSPGTAIAAPPGVGNIEGKVTRPDGSAAASVTVLLIDRKGRPIASTSTDAAGVYGFSGVAAGTYTVRAGQGGPFGTKTAQVKAGQTTVVNFVLPEPLPPPPGEDPIDPPPVLD